MDEIKRTAEENARLRKRWAICLIAGCVVAALIVVLAFPTKREPEHGGKKLSEWLMLYGRSLTIFTDGVEAADKMRKEASDAVQDIGTNALPFLLEWTDYEPAGWKRALWTNNPPAAAQRHGYLRSAYLWMLKSPADDRNWFGRFGFEILGPRARPALPEIQRRMADWRTPWRAARAMDAYTEITGPDAVPALVSALMSTNVNCRQYAAFCLATLGTNGALAAPSLRNVLNDSDPVVRRFAAVALQKVMPQTQEHNAGQKQGQP